MDNGRDAKGFDWVVVTMTVRRCMRYRMLIWFLLSPACASAGIHGGGEAVSWSIARSASQTGGDTGVCAKAKLDPCVLPLSTADRPSFATFTLHLFGPSTTKFTGSMTVGFFGDTDPRKYTSPIDLTANGKEVHHSLFSRVASDRGQYNVRVQLDEIRANAPTPIHHDLTVPVEVR
jgi:hypothetical protein